MVYKITGKYNYLLTYLFYVFSSQEDRRGTMPRLQMLMTSSLNLEEAAGSIKWQKNRGWLRFYLRPSKCRLHQWISFKLARLEHLSLDASVPHWSHFDLDRRHIWTNLSFPMRTHRVLATANLGVFSCMSGGLSNTRGLVYKKYIHTKTVCTAILMFAFRCMK